jgi:glucosamine-6-phosphate deaminase
MEIVICESQHQAADLVADAIEDLVATKPSAVLGLATGSSPVLVYDELGARVAAGKLSLAKAKAFLLDEYVGLHASHPETYRNVIARDFVAKADIEPVRVSGLDGAATDLPRACADYERSMTTAGGVDLQVLGIGADGHIAFNEPGSSFGSRTRIKTLTDQTRHDNARFFGGDPAAVPQHCLTQGIATILEARHIVLLAFGSGKAEAVREMAEGPLSTSCPASALQLHPHVSVLLDEDSAALLSRANQYRETFAAKPAWQRL